MKLSTDWRVNLPFSNRGSRWVRNSALNGRRTTVQRVEVTGTTIRIYEADQAKALEPLRHEYIEYLLTRDLVAPYKRLINKLISLFEEEVYDRKEKLVETLRDLMT